MSLRCHDVLPIHLKQEQMWADDRLAVDLKPDAEAAIAMLENQRVNFAPLADANKDLTVKAEWFVDCDDEVDDTCSDSCDITGARIQRDCKEYELTQCVTKTFKVPIYNADRQDNDVLRYQDEVATAMMRKKKLIAEHIAKQTIAFLNANPGVNAYAGGIGTVSSTTTSIPGSNMNVGAASYLKMVEKKNKFSSSYMLNGDNFWNSVMNAQIDGANDDGKGNAARAQMQKMYWDLFNFADLSLDNVSFMVDPAAVGLVHKARQADYSFTNPREMKGQDPAIMWSENLEALPGVKIDVRVITKCEGSGIYFDYYELKAYYDFLLAPSRCDATNKGILKFQCA